MFDQAHLGRVWTSVEFEFEDEAGATHKRTHRFLVQPLTRAEYQARRKERLSQTNAAVRAALVEAKPPSDEPPSAEQAAEQAEHTLQRLVATIDAATAATEDDVSLLLERTHDWRLTDNAGNAVEFARDTMRALLAYDIFYGPLAQRFDELCRGVVAKNSSPGPAGSAA